jgi:hypothetical protein
MQTQKGSMTVWTVLVLGSILSFLLLVLTGISVKTQKTMANHIVSQATDASMASYCKELFEDYGLLFTLEDNTEAEITSRLGKDKVISNLKQTDYQAELVYATDQQASTFREQVCSYMQDKVTEQVIETLLKNANMIDGDAKEGESCEDTSQLEEEEDKITDLTEKLEKELKTLSKKEGDVYYELNKISGLVDDTLEEKNLSKQKKLWKKVQSEWPVLKKTVRDIKKKIETALADIEEYETYKNESSSLAVEKSSEDDAIIRSKKELKKALKQLKELQQYMEGKGTITLGQTETIKTEVEAYKTKFSNWKIVSTTFEKTSGDDSLYDQIKALLTEGKLALVVKDVSKLSNQTIDTQNLPSGFLNESGWTETDSTLYEKALCSQYLVTYFGNYVNKKSNTALAYEMEYVLGGQARDKDNLSAVVDKLFLVREGVNLVSLLADSSKRSQVSTLALTLVGWTGIVVLKYIAEGIIVAAWSMAESAVDIKTLLAGGKVKLVKGKSDWKLSLENMLNVDSVEGDKNSSEGLSYSQYLQCLILLSDDYKVWGRTMDLIQLNMQKRYSSDFYFSKCISEIKATASFKITAGFGLSNTFTVTYKQAYSG